MRAFVDLGGISSHGDQEAAVLAQVDVALDLAQLLVFRPLDIAFAGSGHARGYAESFEAGQARIPQGTRRAHLRLGRIETGHLPVPARERQLEQRLAQRLGKLVAGFVRDWPHRRPGCAGRRRAGHRRSARPRHGRAMTSTMPVMRRITTVQVAAEKNRRSASELARIGRAEQVAETAHGLNHVDAELLANTPDERPRSCWSRDRSPGRRDARPARCGRPRGRYDASDRPADGIRAR